MKKPIPPQSLDGLYEVGIATTEKELKQIYKLRKQVYSDELNYFDCDSDYLSDDLDAYSTNFHIKYEGQIVGTARFTSELDGELELSQDIDWKQYVRKDRVYCEITRLIFSPEHRNWLGSCVMFKFINDYCIKKKINAIVIGVKLSPIWKRYYQAIGFKVVKNTLFKVNTFSSSPEYEVGYRYFDNKTTNTKFINTLKHKLKTPEDYYKVKEYNMDLI
ncbi:hypothetical protein ACFL2K_00975 [Candidatus Margulisiibacteriota bacterium]